MDFLLEKGKNLSVFAGYHVGSKFEKLIFITLITIQLFSEQFCQCHFENKVLYLSSMCCSLLTPYQKISYM